MEKFVQVNLIILSNEMKIYFIALFCALFLSPGQEQQKIFKANFAIDKERTNQSVSLF